MRFILIRRMYTTSLGSIQLKISVPNTVTFYHNNITSTPTWMLHNPTVLENSTTPPIALPLPTTFPLPTTLFLTPCYTSSNLPIITTTIMMILAPALTNIIEVLDNLDTQEERKTIIMSLSKDLRKELILYYANQVESTRAEIPIVCAPICNSL